MKLVLLIFFFYLLNPAIHAQNNSVKLADSALKKQIEHTRPNSSIKPMVFSLQRDSLVRDSLKKLVFDPIRSTVDTSVYEQYMRNPFLPMDKKPVNMFISFKEHTSKDLLFYIIFSNVFILAFVKLVFPKYFKNLFALFFQTSLRQKQTREQLLQDGVASLLINLLFVISAGLFFTLIIKYKGWSNIAFNNLYGYVIALLLFIYIGKYVFITFVGWVFNNKIAANSYTFIVTMVNRILGILVIPFTIFLAFTDSDYTKIAFILSIIFVVFLLLYRYFVSFASLRNDLKLNAFHFFLYLCSVELLPMLLLYKLMVNYIG